MTMIYDSIRTPHPPQSLGDWEAFWQQHPGRFTIPYEFTGMTLLKSWMVALAGDPQYFKGSFDEVKYKRVSDQLWAFINRNKANFWRKGETFPESLAAVHQMFANKELDFTMSNNDAEVDNKIIQGVFPGTALAYVPAYGSIRNSHYLGIPGGAQNLPGALVAINFLCSPAAQWEKMKPDVWGDGTILAIDGLPAPWPDRFTAIPGRKNAPARNTLDAKALQEPAPEYMIRLYNDFRTRVIDNNR
ncbi:MAG: extracellular solute-binding protein [Lewinellaceae bacterium]|nr:extracellular solute-binding protein [Lewinellaceae bacterium]